MATGSSTSTSPRRARTVPRSCCCTRAWARSRCGATSRSAWPRDRLPHASPIRGTASAAPRRAPRPGRRASCTRRRSRSIPALRERARHRAAGARGPLDRRLDGARRTRARTAGRSRAWSRWRRSPTWRTPTWRASSPRAATTRRRDWREKLARHHDDVDAVFYGWNDTWLRPDFRAWNLRADLAGIRCADPRDPRRRGRVRHGRPGRAIRRSRPRSRELRVPPPRRLRPRPPPGPAGAVVAAVEASSTRYN